MRSATGNSPSRQRKIPFVLLTFIGVVLLILLSLGTWQVKRLIWKQDLMARVDARAHAAPVPAPREWAGLTADNSEYQRVTVTGTYQYQHQEYTQAVTELDGGYWVMTPLVDSSGKTYYINRGFIPASERAAFEKNIPADNGPVTVTGLLRLSQPSVFLRRNEPALHRWYSRDVIVMGQQAGLSQVAPYFIDADRGTDPKALPVGGMTQITFPNNHLVYALTWYGLAVLLIGMLFYVRKKDKGDTA